MQNKRHICVASEYTENPLVEKRIGSFMGTDKETNAEDSSICAALANVDKNHFFFAFPDLVPAGRENLRLPRKREVKEKPISLPKEIYSPLSSEETSQ